MARSGMKTPAPDPPYLPGESFARDRDRSDPLARFRERFEIPRGDDGRDLIYFCGNSLGLLPKSARTLVERELDDWARLGVEGHFRARTPWYPYHETLRDPLARIVGARPEEVVAMNGLTVNLHLMMATFYRPTYDRHAILMEDRPFPSDAYAAQAQIRHHGLDPARSMVKARPRDGEDTVRIEDLEGILEERGAEIALVLLGGVQYHTGQWFDIGRVAAAARRRGCTVGVDLAHAAGNVPLRMHDWGVDFAVWCNYKYLNGGPGAVAGCFVHERHGRDPSLPRLAGWWGNDPETRFQMHRNTEFVPRGGADGWQVSNPPILAMAPLRASLEIFDEAGMEALREKSVRLTGYLHFLLDRIPEAGIRPITPRGAGERGCQLSIRVGNGARDLAGRLRSAGVVVDFREPDVIRVAPVPLYNTFHEVWRFARALEAAAGAGN